MKKVLDRIIYSLFKSKILYLICQKIVFYYKNERNCNHNTNGEKHFINTHSSKFNIVFDVGANIGDWSKMISEVSPESKIYAFEPSKKTFKELGDKKNHDNILIFNISFGDKKEKKTFYNMDDSTAGSSIKRESDSNNSIKEIVEFDTIDNFCKTNNIDHISFLKIDVEGGELNVLKGAEEFIKAGKIDFIQFEYGGTYIDANIRLKDMFDFFKEKPYKIHKIMRGGLQEVNKYTQDLENFQYSNYMAILNNHDNN